MGLRARERIFAIDPETLYLADVEKKNLASNVSEYACSFKVYTSKITRERRYLVVEGSFCTVE